VKKTQLICLIILSVLVLNFGCKTKQKANKTDKMEVPVFVLEKTACYGECPVFTIQIYANGFIEFEGKRFVDKIGNFTNKIYKAEVDLLINDFVTAKFFEFEDKYTSEATDFPTTYITFNHDGRTKKITDYDGAPNELELLEDAVARYIKISNWKQSEIKE